jgi:hypothetical protein
VISVQLERDLTYQYKQQIQAEETETEARRARIATAEAESEVEYQKLLETQQKEQTARAEREFVNQLAQLDLFGAKTSSPPNRSPNNPTAINGSSSTLLDLPSPLLPQPQSQPQSQPQPQPQPAPVQKFVQQQQNSPTSQMSAYWEAQGFSSDMVETALQLYPNPEQASSVQMFLNEARYYLHSGYQRSLIIQAIRLFRNDRQKCYRFFEIIKKSYPNEKVFRWVLFFF